MPYRVNCLPDVWTTVLQTAVPAWNTIFYVDPAFTRNSIKVRRFSAGIPWYWDGNLAANVGSLFVHTPELFYARVEVFPVGGGVATVDVY